MRNERFAELYRELKECAQVTDATIQDFRGSDGIHYDGERRKTLVDAEEDLQNKLEELIRNNELTPKQLKSLEGITYATPGWEEATNVEVGRFSVIESFGGVFAPIKDMTATQEKMELLLTGAGAGRVQGTRSGYMKVRLVRLDRSKR